jgi:hypothetical protein
MHRPDTDAGPSAALTFAFAFLLDLDSSLAIKIFFVLRRQKFEWCPTPGGEGPPTPVWQLALLNFLFEGTVPKGLGVVGGECLRSCSLSMDGEALHK